MMEGRILGKATRRQKHLQTLNGITSKDYKREARQKQLTDEIVINMLFGRKSNCTA